MKHKIDVKEKYFNWLYSIVVTDNSIKKYNLNSNGYSILLHKLHDIEFYWIVELDENRAIDGQSLRDEFAQIGEFDDYSELSGACTMLEFLIGLAKRMSFIEYECNKIDKTDIFFWELIINLLGKSVPKNGTNGVISGEFLDFLCDRVQKFLDKSDKNVTIFKKRGNFTPLFETSKNPIWDQMQQFLMKND